MRVNQATLPADQPVESHHQSEGQACDANEDDAKEYVLHVLTTTAPLVGSELQSNSDNRWPCIVQKVTPSGSNIVSRRRAPTGPLKSPSGGPTGKCEVVLICGLRFLSHGLSTDKWTSHGGFLALPQSTHPAALCAAQLILCVPTNGARYGGALLWSADKLKSDRGERARALWAAKGKQGFAADPATRKATERTFPAVRR